MITGEMAAEAILPDLLQDLPKAYRKIPAQY